ncbi:Ras GTPase-activating protein 1 [Saguinus oedipus]|uniref:Ras GTPase-activating protein 1 n=1 Tax=Saguinus oedipus TaxID=9490 RepID=A0ABQ9W8X8_SAGOE|nr:Ras GTPase-activating protein 1 [Saguinus oedipus]
MMAAEAGSEEGGPVTAGAGGGGAAAGSSAYSAVCRVRIPVALPVAAAPYPGLVETGVAGTLGGGAALGSGFLGTGSVAGALGGAGLTGGGTAAGVAGAAAGVAAAGAGAGAAGPSGDMSLTKLLTSLPAETLGPGGVFPPLPPPPHLPPLGAGLGTVDEGDSLDGPEYEEEEVAIPLTAPPTNQHTTWCPPTFIVPLGRCKVFKLESMRKCVSIENQIWFCPFQVEVVSQDSVKLQLSRQS